MRLPVRLEREREIHGLTGEGLEGTPLGRQGGEERQPGPGLGNGLLVYRHRQRKRRIVDVDAQLIAGTPDSKRDGRAVPVDDGMSYQVAGEQDRDVGIDRD